MRIFKVHCRFAEVSNQMLELYEQNKSNGANGSLANDPSPSDTNRLQAPSELPSSNGHHLQYSPLEKSQTMEVKTDEVSSQRDEDYVAGRVPSSSPLYTPNIVRAPYSDPPSDLPGDTRHGEPSAVGSLLNGRTKQEVIVKKELLRTNGENYEHYHEYQDEVKCSSVRAERTEDAAIGARDSRRRENDDWIAKEKLKERSTIMVKTEVADVKLKTTEEKATEEMDSRKDFTSLDDVNKDKIKAALEKRRKSRGRVDAKPMGIKHEPTNEEELLERELESGVDAAAEAEKSYKDRRDRKMSRVDQEFLVGKENPVDSKKLRAKEEGEGKGPKIEHEVLSVKERLPDIDNVSLKKKNFKEKEGYQQERKQVLYLLLIIQTVGCST